MDNASCQRYLESRLSVLSAATSKTIRLQTLIVGIIDHPIKTSSVNIEGKHPSIDMDKHHAKLVAFVKRLWKECTKHNSSNVHSGVKFFQCNLCEYHVGTEDNLKIHTKHAHETHEHKSMNVKRADFLHSQPMT